MVNNPCPVCSEKMVPIYGGMLECSSCRLVVKKKPDFALFTCPAGLEKEIYYGAKRRLFALALDELERGLGSPGRLLDVGCAQGEFMRLAAARGWKPEGVEMDPELAGFAAGAGFRVWTVEVEKTDMEEGVFDAATVLEVFSLMQEPAAAAAKLYRLLKPGGMIYVREFNAAFHLAFRTSPLGPLFGALGLNPAVLHNFNFRAESLRILLERAGFREVKVVNSRLTSGDPYRTGGRFFGVLLPALKLLYYSLAQALQVLTAGRVLAGSSLVVTARK